MDTRIAGKDWEVFVDEYYRWDWRCQGDKYGGKGWEQGWIAAKMLNDHFAEEEIKAHWISGTEYGRPYGMLYPTASDFLNTWGIKCEVVGLPPIQFEAPHPG